MKRSSLKSIICGAILASCLLPSVSMTAEVPGELREIYHKSDSWVQTMLDSRERIRPTIARQQQYLRQIEFGPWYSTDVLGRSDFSEQQMMDAWTNPTGPASGPAWHKHTEWKDNHVTYLSRSKHGNMFIYRSLKVKKTGVLSVYLGADNAASVWLNGKEVLGERDIGIWPDNYITVDLPLIAGQNHLLLKIYNKGWNQLFCLASESVELTARLIEQFEKDFPIQWDWVTQDAADDFTRWFSKSESVEIENKMIAKVLDELADKGQPFQVRLEELRRQETIGQSVEWLQLYADACEIRRTPRLKTLLAESPHIIFAKHTHLGGTHYAYTEGQSDAQRNERWYNPGGGIYLMEMDGIYPKVKTLLEDPMGMIRDPDVSYDGKRVLFSWRKSEFDDDYHLYEMNLENSEIRQLTSGERVADYEGAYLPNGDIVFNSTRCIQTVDCWWTEVSNIYTCDKDGKYLRRLSFDQVHTNYPQVTHDGRIIYTRWEYNDRSQVWTQPLFQMNPDGTAQREFYGNSSYFPTTLLHGRSIPGSNKVLAIATGHHSSQSGKLILIDPAKGRQENSGAQLISPVRETAAERIDSYGQWGEQFIYPYPLNETEYLVTYVPAVWPRSRYGELLYHRNIYFEMVTDGTIKGKSTLLRFKNYFMTVDGRRELLTADPFISCSQQIPLRRRHPTVRVSTVDYRQAFGSYYLKDVYHGKGLQGIKRGTVKKLRVVALEYRAAGIGVNGNRGPAGGALVSTPVAIGNGTWDVKVVLGETPVYADGSAFFYVPARTPVYFQAIDAKGHVVQTMRSWSTLQPNENLSCVGCHERKNETPPHRGHITTAMKKGASHLDHFYGAPRGFSFPREIQPILDRHCISCHKNRKSVLEMIAVIDGKEVQLPKDKKLLQGPFSLLGELSIDYRAGRRWSDAYLNLTHSHAYKGGKHIYGQWDHTVVNWISPQSPPEVLPPYHKGAAKSSMMKMLEKGHEEVILSKEETDKLACWIDLLVPYCGDYVESNSWDDPRTQSHNGFIKRSINSETDVTKWYAHFQKKREKHEQIEKDNIAQFIRE
ncbi:MAG: hypothetical protein JRI64_03175 [Deltaproteobacteria bacterium]|nr:hypothetical protein [Deltaproteobacteria bacterium]